MVQCASGDPSGDGPDTVAAFCADFASELRERQVSLRRAEQLSGWGKSTIADARRGTALPNVDLVVDVLAALGTDEGELEHWRARHRALHVGAIVKTCGLGIF